MPGEVRIVSRRGSGEASVKDRSIRKTRFAGVLASDDEAEGTLMRRLTAIAIGRFGSGLALGGTAAVGDLCREESARVLDPLLQDGSAFGMTNRQGGHALLRHYQKVAAVLGEVRPFRSSGTGAIETAYAEAEPPLFGDLGTLTVPITTSSPDAKRYFSAEPHSSPQQRLGPVRPARGVPTVRTSRSSCRRRRAPRSRSHWLRSAGCFSSLTRSIHR